MSSTALGLLSPARGSPRPKVGWWPTLRHSVFLIGFSAFLILGLWLALFLQIRREAQDAVHNAEVNLGNLTRAFAEHTARTLESADQAIRFVRSEYVDHGANLDIGAYLHNKAIIESTFHLISVIGPDGYVTHSSKPFQRVDLRDREHFRVHADGHADRLFVSKPVLGRVSKKWSIQLTRRIDTPDGGFGGVVVLSLSPEYLTRFYRDVNLGQRGTITLVGFDGVVRARAVGNGSDADGGQDIRTAPTFQEAMRRRNGTIRAPSAIDHVDRIWAFRALDASGLLVFTGIDTNDVLAEANERRELYLWGAGLVTLVIAGFVAGLLRRSRIQQSLVKQLEHSNRQANAANEMKTKFLASVSHELRTPLNGILGFAELLQDTAADPEAREYGRVIHQSGQHLHNLVNAILDLAKIESGRMTVHPTPLNLAEFLGNIHALNAMHAQTRGLVLHLDLRSDCPVQITSDGMRLTQILNNLLNNAVKFTDAGEIRMTARGDSDHLIIEVADSGSGIPENVLSSVFTRFHATTTRFHHPAQGAGLGLPLAHELTGLLGGSLTLVSHEGVGTTVTLRLPVVGPEIHLEDHAHE